MIRLRGHDLMLRKIELDASEGLQQDQDTTRLLLDLIGQTAPRMKPISETAEQIRAADVLLRGRIESQRLATGIGIKREAGGEKSAMPTSFSGMAIMSSHPRNQTSPS